MFATVADAVHVDLLDPAARDLGAFRDARVPTNILGLPTTSPSAAPAGIETGPFSYRAAGCEFSVATPRSHPELWREYLDGAVANYRRFRVEHVVEYESVLSGDSTSLFFAAVNQSGRVVGGMRAQGPYRSAKQAHALAEWAGAAGTDELRSEIESRIPHGVIEMKAGWVAADAPNRRALTSALARIFLHAIRLTGVRYALCTVATHAVPKWTTTGGEISLGVTPVAYPDPRYSTVPMWWDRDKPLPATVAAVVEDEHERLRSSGTIEPSPEASYAA